MKQFIEEQQPAMLKLLETLVNQDSGSDYKEGVDKVGQLLIEQMQHLHFQPQIIEQSITGNHLIFTHEQATAPKILLVAHMDTVFGSNTVSTRPFTIEGERAYGPGVIDMKGSHVSLIYALKALAEEKANAVLQNIQILFNSDEEIGSPTSQALIEQLAQGKDCCLCMEPARANGALVSARRGGGGYTIKVFGKASHAGIAPYEGANAIAEMAHKIIALQQLNDEKAGISVNVDVIHGGTAANVIADFVEASVDIRTSKVEQGPILKERIRAICDETHIAGTRCELYGDIKRPPMERNEGTRALIDRIQQVAQTLSLEVTDVATGGGGDASFTSLHTPTIDGLGPVGGLAHSAQEYLEIPSLTERTLLLAKLMESLTIEKLATSKVFA